ncbi:hypothetical protein [Methyloversatilis thermotolerans]|uniref:hypothetical protein n=1 Tax=Methyloversatilis thermotolerans TaxID=1346290 RepID=UPI00037F2281|nr:hypothetical protein [Methyloversatilis thermotolerans]
MNRAARHLFRTLFCLAPFVALAHAAPEPACQVESSTPATMDVVCLIPLAAAPQQFEFQATFSGSHDDTRLKIETALDGKSLACDKGSKTESEFEDGDITLNCRFSVSGAQGSTARLKTGLRWSHAEYAEHRLLRR